MLQSQPSNGWWLDVEFVDWGAHTCETWWHDHAKIWQNGGELIRFAWLEVATDDDSIERSLFGCWHGLEDPNPAITLNIWNLDWRIQDRLHWLQILFGWNYTFLFVFPFSNHSTSATYVDDHTTWKVDSVRLPICQSVGAKTYTTMNLEISVLWWSINLSGGHFGGGTRPFQNKKPQNVVRWVRWRSF